MVIDLANTNFVNDMFSTMLPNGNTLLLNLIDESLLVDGQESIIKAVNVELLDADNNLLPCSNVIGLESDYMIISTNYKQYEGAVLTPDNMMYCTIEVYD